jgi:AcrR family transcriptional regulator
VVASQRDRIQHAMVEVVNERGYAETSVGELLDRAGVSRKTFYEQYPTKETCLLAIYDDAARCLRGIVQRGYERGVTPQERIDAAVGVLIEWIEGEPELARLCVLETATSGQAGHQRVTATLTWLTGVMADVLGDLDVPELLPELLVGGLHQMLCHRLLDDAVGIDGLAGDLDEVWTTLERWDTRRSAA